MVGTRGRNRILGIRIAFIDTTTYATMQWLCCYHWRPKEANTFHVIPLVFDRGCTISNVKFFLKKKFFETKLIKTKETATKAES
jgi:hypothetical protein